MWVCPQAPSLLLEAQMVTEEPLLFIIVFKQFSVAPLKNERCNRIVRRLLEYPYLPSPLPVIDIALDLAQFASTDVFADLGCGDGTVLIRAAQRFKIFCVGFEIDHRFVNIARRNVKVTGLANLVDIVYSDFFTIDLSRVNVIYVFPFPPVITGLSRKIIDECSVGSRILVHDYPLEKMSPVKVIQVPSRSFHIHTIYLYKQTPQDNS